MSKPQRRKGNLQSASSSRAADWLASSGQAVPLGAFATGLNNPFEVAADLHGQPNNELDSEVVLVVKKLSKKDALTREKALRELIDLLSSKPLDVIQSAYFHYTSVFDKLALDGSGPVRAFSLRAVSFFISTLKKGAQKQLRLVLPFVLFETCDVSASVVLQAENVLNDNFPGEKRHQVISMFAPQVASLAVQLLKGSHPLLSSQRYDSEEDADLRMNRLCAQSLQVLAKMRKSLDVVPEEFDSAICSLFDDSTTIKRLLKLPGNVKTGVLALALHGRSASSAIDLVNFILSSPLAPWILQNLDSTDPAIARCSFDAFVQLACNSSFFEKFDPKKSVVPRILNVIRRKAGHWRDTGPLILPSIAVVYEALLEPERADFLCSVLSSMPDNLPFEERHLLAVWSSAVGDCAKFALTRLPNDVRIRSAFKNLMTTWMNFVTGETPEVFDPAVKMLRWAAEKAELPESEWTEMSAQILSNLINERPTTDPLCLSLLSPPLPRRLQSFFIALCRSQPTSVLFLALLQGAHVDLVRDVDHAVDLVGLITQTHCSRREEELLARVLITVLRVCPRDSFKLSAGSLSDAILSVSAASDDLWAVVEKYLPADRERLLKETLLSWLEAGVSTTASTLLSRLSLKERDSIVAEIISTPRGSELEALAGLAASIQLSQRTGSLVSKHMFERIFSADADSSDADVPSAIISVLQVYPPPKEVQNVPWDYAGSIECTERGVQHAAFVASALCLADSAFDFLLPDQSAVLSFLRTIDEFMAVDVCITTPLISSVYVPSGFRQSDLDWGRARRRLAGRALFSLKTSTQQLESRRWALCISAVNLALCRLGPAFKRSFDEDVWFEQKAADSFETAVQNDEALVSVVLSALCSLPSPLPRVVLLAIRHLEKYSSCFKLTSALNETHRTEVLWALRQSTEGVRLGTVDRWVARFHSSSNIDFLAHLCEFASLNRAEWECELFTFSDASKDMWCLNVCALSAACGLLESSPPAAVDPPVLDFVMCGLITAFDSIDEWMSSGRGHDVLCDTFASLSLSLFKKCSTQVAVGGNETFEKEWADLFYPTLSRIIVRWYVEVLDAACPDSSAFTRSLCAAIWSLNTYDWELACHPKYTPLLDQYGYCGEEQALVVQSVDLLKSTNHYVQFAAVHVLRLISTKMYRQENGIWDDEKEDALEGARKRRTPPSAVSQIATDSLSLPACLALDICLTPLSELSSHAERVSYCDGLVTVISHALPVLLSQCSSPIPRSQQRVYFTEVSPLESQDSLHRYACSLLFRMVELVPALIRSWFNKLDSAPAKTVSKFFRESVSSLAVEAELAKVREGASDIGGDENSLKVRTLPVSGEVIAEYTVEETTMRLVIAMPPDWPLTVPQVTLDKAIVASERAKKWLLQLTAFLFHQNGTMVEGMISWRRQVDRDVSGAEACTICMMTIHSSSHQLPRVRCKQCKNKFHSNCLYKWFESSNQSTCPLCRAHFT